MLNRKRKVTCCNRGRIRLCHDVAFVRVREFQREAVLNCVLSKALGVETQADAHHGVNVLAVKLHLDKVSIVGALGKLNLVPANSIFLNPVEL